MDSKYIYKELEIIHIKKKGLKNIYISINKNKEIFVKTNLTTAKHKVLSLVEQKFNWIQKHISKFEKVDKDVLKQEAVYFLGQKYIVHKSGEQVLIEDEKIYIPHTSDINNTLKVLYRQNIHILQSIVDECIQKSNLFPTKVGYRYMHTRWGSCGSKNQISLNTQLLKFPKHLIEYVVYHELSHIVHKNHSKNFWSLVAKFTPNYKEYRKALRYY